MARYTFTCEHFNYNDFNGDEQNVASKHTTQFHADDLNTMIENFEMFLRGSGFHFKGKLDFFDDEEWDNSFDDDKEDNSVNVMKHMVDDLLKNVKTESIQSTNPENCPMCNLPKATMEMHMCWEPKCPIQETKSYSSEK